MDANGQDLGLLLGYDGSETGNVQVYRESLGAIVDLSRSTGQLWNQRKVYFKQENCQGQGYVDPALAGVLVSANGQTRFFIGQTVASEFGLGRSFLQEVNPICTNTDIGGGTVVEATEVTGNLGFVVPVALPVHPVLPTN